MEQLLQCQICTMEYTKENQIYTFNCGHACCQKCGKTLEKCHVCKLQIEEFKLDELRQKRRDYIDNYLSAKYLCGCGECQQIKYYCSQCNILFCTDCVFQHIEHPKKMKKINTKQITEMIQQQIDLFRTKIEDKQDILSMIESIFESKTIDGKDILEITQSYRDQFLSNEYEEDDLSLNIYDFKIQMQPNDKKERFIGVIWSNQPIDGNVKNKMTKSQQKINQNQDVTFDSLLKQVKSKTLLIFRQNDQFLRIESGILMVNNNALNQSNNKTVFVTDFMKIKMSGVLFMITGNSVGLYHSNGSCYYAFNIKTGVISQSCFNCQTKTLFQNNISVSCGNSPTFFGMNATQCVEVYDYE